MLQDDQKIISVDDHIIEHPRVWLDRLPSKWADVAPRVVDLPPDHPAREGSDEPMQQWLFEGTLDGIMQFSAAAGTPLRERGNQPTHYDQMRRGCYDVKSRLADMDEEGIWAQVCFPNTMVGFAGGRFRNAKDPELGKACLTAWNDYVIDEWCAAAPDRFIPLVVVPFWDLDAAVAELERVAAKGARAFSFPDNPAHLGLPSFHTDHWDPLWSAVEDADLPVCMHFGSGTVKNGLSDDAPMAASTTLLGSTLSHSMVELIFSPTLHSHPRLKIVYSEGQIGWMPFFVHRMDHIWGRYRFYRATGQLKQRINTEIPPSELFKRHVWGCFIDDPIGLMLRHEIGIDKIMYEADFPHDDSHWPTTRADAAKALADIPDDEVKKIVEDNARVLFRFPA